MTDNTDTQPGGARLGVRPVWTASTRATPFFSFDEAVAAVLRDPVVEGAAVSVAGGGSKVTFEREGRVVAMVYVKNPPPQAEVRAWLLDARAPGPGARLSIQNVRELADEAAAHFDLQLSYESDWSELRRFVGETMREAGAEIEGWGDWLLANTPISRLKASHFIGREREAGGQPGEVVESSPFEILKLVIGGLATIAEVQAAMGVVTRLCRARIEEIASAAADGIQDGGSSAN